MAGIRTSATLAGSDDYGRNWDNFEHETPLGLFCFEKRELGGWYLLVEETISGNVACHPDKERDSRGCEKRNNSSIG